MTALKKYFIVFLFALFGVGTFFASTSIFSRTSTPTIIGINEAHATAAPASG